MPGLKQAYLAPLTVAGKDTEDMLWPLGCLAWEARTVTTSWLCIGNGQLARPHPAASRACSELCPAAHPALWCLHAKPDTGIRTTGSQLPLLESVCLGVWSCPGYSFYTRTDRIVPPCMSICPSSGWQYLWQAKCLAQLTRVQQTHSSPTRSG